MKRRIISLILVLCFFISPVYAEPIRWVDFFVPYESLKYAMETDIAWEFWPYPSYGEMLFSVR